MFVIETTDAVVPRSYGSVCTKVDDCSTNLTCGETGLCGCGTDFYFNNEACGK